MKLKIKPHYADRLVWSHPDSRIAPFCSLCQEYIDEEAMPPLKLWNHKGSCAQLCDGCARSAIEVAQ